MIFCYSSYPYLISDHYNIMCNSSSSQLTRPVASRNRMWTSLGLPMSRLLSGSLALSAQWPELNWCEPGSSHERGQAGRCCMWHRWCETRLRWPGITNMSSVHTVPASLYCLPTSETRGEGERYYLVVFRKYFDEDSTSCLAASHHFKRDCEVSSLRGYSRSFVQNLSVAQTPEISSWLLVNIWMPGKSNLVSIWIVHSNNPSVHGRPLLITSSFESFHVFKYFICWNTQ